MKTPFIHENFLLENETARRLYYGMAVDLPVIDYHNHLPPDEIVQDVNYKNLTQIWLAGDHYKWRAMRACGVDEKYITGDATDKDKFLAWAETVPKTLRNPLYHWTHMELAFPFGINGRLLNGETAEEIWDECNEMLKSPEFSTRSLLQQFRVEVVATTDDPTDSLEYHQAYQKEKNTDFLMVPTFRPDAGMKVENPDQFKVWVNKLEASSDKSISSFQDFLDAIKLRHDFFHEMGCRASDHGITEPFSDEFTDKECNTIFQKALSGKPVLEQEERKFKSAFLHYSGLMDHEKEWVYQLHIGALRNNNSRMMKKLGPDTGFDSMGDFETARPLSRLLDRLDRDNKLPRTVLYNNNPCDNEVFATMTGNFQDGTIPGKMQHGPPWWHLDQKNGIENQLEVISNMGVLSEFIGMTTDSRSFLSFSRHDYFRRILCNVIGNDAEKGLIPNDIELLSHLIEKICYLNTKKYFRYDSDE